MNLYQLYSNPAELKWHSEANVKIPEVFAVDQFGDFDYSKKYTLAQIKEIAKDAQLAYLYARDVLKQRWPEAEPYIMKVPRYAYYYAYYNSLYFINGRWEEAEPYIMKDPFYAIAYAEVVLRHRWILAEPYIKTNTKGWIKYKKHFKIVE